MKRLALTLSLIASGLPVGSAHAELWNALDTVPRPNAVIGYDTSVTMRIDARCSSCHRSGLIEHLERVNLARVDLLDTMPLFRDYFVFGGFQYQGCVEARVVRSVRPDVDNPDGSFNATRSMLRAARGCNSSEERLPTTSMTNCITASPMCRDDPPVIEAIFRGGLDGLRLPSLPTHTSTVCGNPASTRTRLDLEAFLISRAGSMEWPRWGAHVTGRHAREDLCEPLYGVLAAARTALNRCLVDPEAYWDLSGIGPPPSGWCVPGRIANDACTGSPFLGTCVCDPTQPLCRTTGSPTSECDVPLTWKARQQVAVCETYDDDAFGRTFREQGDNIVEGGCRENVAMFFTDGYQGHTPGVQTEAHNAQDTYASASGRPNMFVFHVSDSFTGQANRMMQLVTEGQITTAFEANDAGRMRSSFSQMLARIYQGDYAGTSPALSYAGDRVALSWFSVPGYTPGAPVSDTYIGWPMRVALHAIDEGGVVESEPLFRTDWASKVSGGSACGTHQLGLSPRTALLGPGGTFDNGTPRAADVPVGALGDRDGDGDADPTEPLRWGRFFGFGAGKPIIVEAPNEVPRQEWAEAWSDHIDDHEDRPRMVYAMGGGYVLGFHGGAYDGEGSYGGLSRSHTYDDDAPQAGTEVLRYLPRWMARGAQSAHNPRYDLDLNTMVPQRLTTGEMVAREVYFGLGAGEEFRTLLVGAQGKEGAGYFVLDVTNPCSPRLVSEWLLPPGAYASARPEVYYFPRLSPPRERPVVVTTGGLDGLPLILAYDVETGAELSRYSLPSAPDTSYPSAPVCVDVTGEGVVTHCYAVRSDGAVARVTIDISTGSFSGAMDIRPDIPASHAVCELDGTRVFSTEPAVFFGSEGAVHLVFGSGSHENLTQTGPRNCVYKVVDPSTRREGVPVGPGDVGEVCAPTGGGDTVGVFPLPAGHRVVSPPIVRNGVVAWTTYHAATSGCVSGDAYLFGMRHDSCADALGHGTERPEPVPVGQGLPASPVLHATSGTLLTRTSAGPGAEGVGAFSADTSGGDRPWARKLYWRYELDVR